MILLYYNKDPHGKNSTVVNSQMEGTLNGFTSTVQNNKCEELEKKVTMLGRVVLDKDKRIAELLMNTNVTSTVTAADGQTQVHAKI